MQNFETPHMYQVFILNYFQKVFSVADQGDQSSLISNKSSLIAHSLGKTVLSSTI